MILREYQHRAIADLRQAYRTHRAPCLVLPTGGGKTVIAAAIINAARERNRRILFLAHRDELLRQTVSKLRAVGLLDLRLIQGATDLGSPIAPVTVASVPTLANRLDRLPKADLVVFDEAHHVKADTWTQIAKHYADSHLLGMTATPQRGDGRPLGDIFDALVVGSTVAELTSLGHLVPCRAFAPPNILDTAELAMSPAAAYAQHGNGERAVVFCRDRKHATEVAAEMGGEVVHGAMPIGKRQDILARFERGDLRVVTNVQVLTEGWDCPPTAVCILAKKPQHAGTYLQMLGRVLRPAPGKTHATVIDLCGASLVHGLPETEREYTLDGKGINRSDRQPIRQCQACGGVFVAGPEACPMCGTALPKQQAKAVRSIDVGVVPIEQAQPKPMRPVFLESKYPGTCRVCRNAVRQGDRIAWSKGAAPAHELCWANEVMCA